MEIIGEILLLLLNICFWIVIIHVIFSWLIAFEVINVRNPQAANAIRLMDRVTTPVYTPLRKFIPPVAGIDLTPIVIIVAISLLKGLVTYVFFH